MNEQPHNSFESHPAAAFDPDRAARVRSRAQDAFLAKYRKIERITWAYLLGCMLVAWWCVRRFLAADDVRSWIVWAVIFVIAFEATILMKLWYWVVNAKLGVLREVKLLRMDLALHEGSSLSGEAFEQLACADSPVRGPGLARWERYAWTSALIAVGILVGVEVGSSVDRHYRALGSMTSESEITLRADGRAQVQTTYDLVNTTSRRIKSMTVYSGGTIAETQWIPAEESPWTDGQGRRLTVRREPDPRGPNIGDVIQLLDPVPPGQHYTLHHVNETSAQRREDVWVFNQDRSWGYRRNNYRETLILPKGAQVVSVDPEPASREIRNGEPVLHFEGERGAGAKWVFTVEYRLPGS